MARKPAAHGTRAKSSAPARECEFCHHSFGYGFARHQRTCRRISNISEATDSRVTHVSIQPENGAQYNSGEANNGEIHVDKLPQILPKEHPRSLESADNSPLPDGESDLIEIIYHPASRLPAFVVPLEDFVGVLKPINDDSGRHSDSSEDPWSPFRTEADLVFAEKCIRNGFDNSTQQEWLDFAESLERGLESTQITFTSYRDLQKTIELAASSYVGFETATINVPFRNSVVKYDVSRKPVWDWVKEILSDKSLCEQFTFHAQRKTKISGTARSRVYDEPWTGNKWWDIQSLLPMDSLPICLLLWSDEGVISHFGGRKSYPVVCRILNLPVSVRNGRGVACGRIIGWLPVLDSSSDLAKENQAQWPDHRRLVWHMAEAYILESLNVPSAYGEMIVCGDGHARHLVPVIPIVSMDYKEQILAAHNRGVNGICACPECEEETVNFDKALKPGKLRTTAAYTELLNRSDDTRDEYKQLGMVRMENCFFKFPYTDIFSAMSYDVLHAFELGIWKRLWRFLKSFLNENVPGSQARMQQRLASLPPWSGLTTFPNVLEVGLADGSSYADLLRVVMHGIHPEVTKEHELVLKCVRSVGVIGIYAKLKVHTEETIAEGRREVAKLSKYLRKTTQNYGWTWATSPKVHALFAHLFDHIEAKGSTVTYNAKINEQMHGPLKKMAARFNNSQATLGAQLLKQDHYRVVLASMLDAVNERKHGLPREPGPESVKHVHLCARGPVFECHAPPHLSLFPFSGDKFSQLIYQFLEDEQLAVATDEITFQQFFELDIDFISEEDWTTSRSILHCKADYHKRPRYDTVIIQSQGKSPIFARLLLLFQATRLPDIWPLACVRCLTPVKQASWKDKAVGFRRLREVSGAKGVQIISLDSVIRGVYMVETGAAGEFYVNDLIDNDMFLRIHRS